MFEPRSTPDLRHDGLHRFEHQGVLGTAIDVRIGAADEEVAALVDAAVIAEMVRLEHVLSAFDESSELCRWRRGEDVVVCSEFSKVMGQTLEWQVRSDGGFNPMVGELGALWRRAEINGRMPDPSEVAAVAAAVRPPRFAMVDGSPVPTGDCSMLSLNAIAKGYIVDRALVAGERAGALSVCVNAGGDLAHRGSGTMQVGIENPHRPYDNEPALTVIEIAGSAVATSGDARRGFQIGEQWLGHVIDPHTGRPVDAVASITVVAGDAMTADVLATVAGVMDPDRAVEYLDGLDGVCGLVVDRDRRQWPTMGWASLVIS